MIDVDRYAGGILVVSYGDCKDRDPASALRAAGITTPTIVRRENTTVATWGALVAEQASGSPVVISGLARGPRAAIPPAAIDLATATAGDETIWDLMPPFAALQIDDRSTVRAATDMLGFRHVYHRRGDGWSAVSTSSLVLAHLDDARIDRQGVAVQAMLGWQLGDRTLIHGVRKLRERQRITLHDGELTIDEYAPASPHSRIPIDTAVSEASTMLSDYMVDYLDENPDAILQLTGGLDSRILLAAIPRSRRKGLRVLTLSSGPDSEDVRIAAQLAERYGMVHLVQGLSELSDLDPSEAHALVMFSARQLNGMADPVAHAALLVVESAFPQGARISGLGGEVARGFYYVGPVIGYPVARPLTRLLVDWRMFANDSVATGALNAEFGEWARPFATDEVHQVLLNTGLPWPDATDRMYLYERMQRWSGVVDSAVCLGRATVNPMLDPRFIDIANSLAPVDKAHARFLAQLVCRLDPELAEIPLEGRRAPLAYAAPGLGQRLTNGVPVAQKAGRKIAQRLRNTRRPPAGGDTLTTLLTEHWRRNPSLLDPVRKTRVFDDQWLDGMLAGAAADPSTTALLASMVALSPS
ncbi:hypothetical protein [Flexivirga oryzae]|uniref:Asparagine synthase (Glutamine-hydrolyzing) n=1 Tax=Flexivirga oryzae TaxID=1794944 RepID=A0A839N5X4_9MICO|nr:hypothetical protein [Flexivirga oryzae]MBB2890151.1 asparagine synthase (glutamine-hydrolyzing) [Flexivirga oryzae]